MTTKINLNNIDNAVLAELLPSPVLANVQYYEDATYANLLDDTAVSLNGGNIQLNGSGLSNVTVKVGNTTIASGNITVVDNNTLRFQVPSASAGSYNILVINNVSGDIGVLISGITYSAFPAWSTGSELAPKDSGEAFSVNLSASSDSNIVYTVDPSSSLPANVTLAANGLLSGTITVGSDTTYNFVIRATDEENQNTNRTFSITITSPDEYYRYNSTLLTMDDEPFIADNSDNKYTLAPNGDTRPSAFNPFNDSTSGSAYLDGSGDYLSTPSTNIISVGDGDEWTVEGWYYFGTSTSDQTLMYISGDTGTAGALRLDFRYGNRLSILISTSSTTNATNQIIDTNQAPGSTYTGFVTNSTWYHIAAVRTGNRINIYLNGSWIFQSNVYASLKSGTINYIGALNWNGAQQYYQGYVSNFRVVDGTAVYTSNFTPSTNPLTKIANTSLLTLQSRIGYNNNQAVNESNVASVVNTVNQTTMGTFSPHVPTGWSGYFDGDGDWINAANNAAFDFNSENFTISMWFYIAGNSATSNEGARPATLFSCWATSGSVTNGYQFNIGGNTTTTGTGLDFTRRLSSVNTYLVYTATITQHTWHHVALVRNGSTMTIYYDGVNVAEDASWSGNVVTGGYPFNIGALRYSGYLYHLNGYIADFSVLKGTAIDFASTGVPTAPLTAIANTSLLTLRGPGFTDDGPNRLAITRNGDTKITPFSPFKPHTITPDSYSVYFDGTGDYLVTGGGFPSGQGTEFTMECWIYVPSLRDQSITRGTSSSGNSGGYFDWAITSGGAIKLENVFVGSICTSSNGAVQAGTWHHVAVTRTTGNIYKIYVDGLVVATSSAYNTSMNANNTLGYNAYSSSLYWSGYISNFRVTNTLVYTSAFIPNTVPLTSVSGTSLLACQSSTFIDNSDNAFAITANGNSQPTKVNPFGETVTTGVEYSPAIHGGSAYFDAADDKITINDAAELELGNSSFTLECWVYPIGTATTMQILDKGWSASSRGPMIIWITTAAGEARLYATTQEGSWTIANGQIFGNTDRFAWNHIALTRNGSTWRGFLNGRQSFTFTNTGTLLNNSVQWGIGNRQDNATDFNGWISDFRIIKGRSLYDGSFVPPSSALSTPGDTTIHINGNSAAIKDRSGKRNIETIGTSKLANNLSKYGKGSVFMDGNSDYLRLDNTTGEFTFGTGDFTVEGWLYLLTNNVRKTFYSGLSTGSFDIQVNVGVNLGVGRSDVGYDMYGTTGTLNLNQWYHLAVTRASGTMRIFLDGALINSASNSISYGALGGFAIVGSSQVTYHFFHGYIDEFRVTKGFARYTSAFTPARLQTK